MSCSTPSKAFPRRRTALSGAARAVNRAREALSVLSQDLSGFNLENYRRIEGHHTLADLGAWVRAMILHLGGAAMPEEGSFWTLHVPEKLQRKYHLAPRYERICFDRKQALRARNSELGGIGHPLVDALLNEAKDPAFAGSTARLGLSGEIFARYLVQYEDEGGKAQTCVMTFKWIRERTPELISSIDWLGIELAEVDSNPEFQNIDLKETFTDALGQYLVEWQPDRTKRARVQTTLIGVHAR
jgi:hypothetical protein